MDAVLTLALALAVGLGCLYWFAWFAAAAASRSAVPFLADLDPPEPDRWPRLSVVAAARDEAAGIEAAARSRMAAEYPHLQLVLVDDRSRDGTGAIIDALAAEDPRVTAIHVDELPDGWLGKVNALERGRAAADGDWILFTDADVHFAPGTLQRAVAYAEASGLDFLAVFPQVTDPGFGLQAAICAFSRVLTLGQRLWAVPNPHSNAHMGVGAFNLVRRSALEATDGLAWLKHDVADDVALGKLMKDSGARCGLASGRDMVSVEWYGTVGALARGLEKNSFVMLGCSLWQAIAAVAVLVWLELAPWVALAWPHLLGPEAQLPGVSSGFVQGLGLAAIVVGGLTNAGMALSGRLAPLPAIASPIGTGILGWVLLRAAVIGVRQGGVQWRGTFYPSAALRAGRRW